MGTFDSGQNIKVKVPKTPKVKLMTKEIKVEDLEGSTRFYAIKRDYEVIYNEAGKEHSLVTWVWAHSQRAAEEQFQRRFPDVTVIPSGPFGKKGQPLRRQITDAE
jgi:hypothetical protein